MKSNYQEGTNVQILVDKFPMEMKGFMKTGVLIHPNEQFFDKNSQKNWHMTETSCNRLYERKKSKLLPTLN